MGSPVDGLLPDFGINSIGIDLVKVILITAGLLLFCPFTTSAESYSAGLARIQLPKIQRAQTRAKKAIGVGDIGTACSEMRTVVLLTRMNLDGLEQITTDFDWFEALQEYRSAELHLCGSNV